MGERRAPHTSAFYLGNDPARWRTGVPNFEAVRYAGVYPGVDLVYHGRGRRLEYDFELAPGADPERIRLRYEGAENLALSASGDLMVTTTLGRLVERAPVAWQEKDGMRHPVTVAFRLLAENSMGFRVVGLLDPEARSSSPGVDYGTFPAAMPTRKRAISRTTRWAAWVVGTTYSPNFPARARRCCRCTAAFVSRPARTGSRSSTAFPAARRTVAERGGGCGGQRPREGGTGPRTSHYPGAQT
jgi:hypothetical protein